MKIPKNSRICPIWDQSDTCRAFISDIPGRLKCRDKGQICQTWLLVETNWAAWCRGVAKTLQCWRWKFGLMKFFCSHYSTVSCFTSYLVALFSSTDVTVGLKWDKSGTFFYIRFHNILAHRAKMFWNLIWKIPTFVPFWGQPDPIWWAKLATLSWASFSSTVLKEGNRGVNLSLWSWYRYHSDRVGGLSLAKSDQIIQFFFLKTRLFEPRSYFLI